MGEEIEVRSKPEAIERGGGLMRLPPGDWIDPADVRAISVSEPMRGEAARGYKPFVYVDRWERPPFPIPCESIEEARIVRDELAMTINACLSDRRER